MKFSPENQMMRPFGKAASLSFTISSFWDSYPLSSKSLYMGTFPIYLYLVRSFCLVVVDRVRWQPLIMTAKVLLILFPIFSSHLLSDHFTCSSFSPDKWATRLHSIPPRLYSFSFLYPGCFLAIFPPQVTVFVLKIEHFNFVNSFLSSLHQASLVAQMAEESAYWRFEWMTLIWALGREDTLEMAMATHSSILAWKILWTKEPDRLQSIGP